MQSSEEFVKFLGKGIYGSVDLVKYRKTDGSLFHAAVKSSNVDEHDTLQKEFRILSELKGCPRIVQCFGNDLEEGLDEDGKKIYKLRLEYASQGSLRAFMDNFNDRKLPDSMIREFTSMIVEGVVSIHSHGYVHCDLKPDNILVFPSKEYEDLYDLKISDFGICVEDGKVPDHWNAEYPFVGTANYMPPESFHDGVAKKALDMWSLGCLVLEMYLGEHPWKGFKSEVLVSLISGGNAPRIPDSVPCDAREFIETCFARNPNDRGTAPDLLKHRFLRGEEKKTDSKLDITAYCKYLRVFCCILPLFQKLKIK